MCESGRKETSTSSSVGCSLTQFCSTVQVMLSWVTITALGGPVVPEVSGVPVVSGAVPFGYGSSSRTDQGRDVTRALQGHPLVKRGIRHAGAQLHELVERAQMLSAPLPELRGQPPLGRVVHDEGLGGGRRRSVEAASVEATGQPARARAHLAGRQLILDSDELLELLEAFTDRHFGLAVRRHVGAGARLARRVDARCDASCVDRADLAGGGSVSVQRDARHPSARTSAKYHSGALNPMMLTLSCMANPSDNRDFANPRTCSEGRIRRRGARHVPRRA